MRAALWNETEYQFRKAQERLTRVEANRRVKVEEEDLSDDFSPGEAHEFAEPPVLNHVDQGRWEAILSRVGDCLAAPALVQSSGAGLSIDDRTTYMVNSEGSRLAHSNDYLRVTLWVRGMADDGMEIRRSEYHSAASVEKLPDEKTLMADAERLVGELAALVDAPIVEPYIGPAILKNRASGVFFHEIFGHRIEGHRQKSESEGQTFTKKVGQEILPSFISVYDDPTLSEFNGTDLRGYYRYDDEGTPAERVTVVEKGVLRNFLTTRSPIDNFPMSNGHGRREVGNDVVARQGNLIVESEKRVPYDELRRMLIAECKRQGKPYGLVFEDIAGGFTMTGRGGPQAFKVLPLLVWRVYPDGRPDEVVRGVDIVGTPLTSFSKIIMAGEDDDVFNGTCGAESGWVPVSAVSPSILVSEIEVEKQQKGQEKPPILPPPGHGGVN
jgi:predicted Zn-dependent protease